MKFLNKIFKKIKKETEEEYVGYYTFENKEVSWKIQEICWFLKQCGYNVVVESKRFIHSMIGDILVEIEDIYADGTFMRQSKVIQIKYCEEGYLEGCFYIEKIEEIKSILMTLSII